MRRHRVLALEEVPENTFLCSSEGCHIGAGRCAAKHRYERDDQQLTQIMSGVLGAVIGDFLKGGQEQMHGGDELQKDESTVRIHPRVSRKPCRSARPPQMRFPCRYAPEPSAEPDAACFLPVEIVDRPLHDDDRAAVGPVPAAGTIEIDTTGGHRLRISGAYDAEALARLIRGLSG